MKKQKVCALFCIAAISMSLATPAKADDRYPSLNETEETLNEKENQEEYELPDDIVVIQITRARNSRQRKKEPAMSMARLICLSRMVL